MTIYISPAVGGFICGVIFTIALIIFITIRMNKKQKNK